MSKRSLNISPELSTLATRIIASSRPDQLVRPISLFPLLHKCVREKGVVLTASATKLWEWWQAECLRARLSEGQALPTRRASR